jgi:hypothetical protein
MGTECEKCCKKFPDNSSLKRHLNRKYPCDANKDDKLACKYCKKKFTQLSSVTRHHKICKLSPSKQVGILDLKLKKQEEKFKEEIQELKKIISDKSVTNPNVTNNNNTTNNTTNNDNSTNNTINITIQNMLPYNAPNTSYIDGQEWAKKLAYKTATQISGDFTEYIFLNPEHPENHSIYNLAKLENNAKLVMLMCKNDMNEWNGMYKTDAAKELGYVNGEIWSRIVAGHIPNNNQTLIDKSCDISDGYEVGITDAIIHRVIKHSPQIKQYHSKLPKKERPDIVFTKTKPDEDDAEYLQYLNHKELTRANLNGEVDYRQDTEPPVEGRCGYIAEEDEEDLITNKTIEDIMEAKYPGTIEYQKKIMNGEPISFEEECQYHNVDPNDPDAEERLEEEQYKRDILNQN